MKLHAKANRSLVKSITWRILATLTTMLLVWIAFGRIDKAIGVGIIEFILKLIVYYGHERAWARVSWGLVSYD
jgi:adenylylsulfate kinase